MDQTHNLGVKLRFVYFLKYFFIIFVVIYALIFLINPQLGPTDDFVFLRTLQVGKPLLYYSADFPYYDSVELGRFTPLGALEYNFIGLFSNSPFWYFFYHAVQFIIFAILLVKILTKVTQNRLLIYLSSLLLFFLPSFTISWFRLQLNERNVIFFLAVFLLYYLLYLKKQKSIYFILGLISANLAIYYKETAFIAIGVFAFSHLLLSWKTASKKIKNFDELLILSSAGYIAIYYFYIWLNRGPALYLGVAVNPFLIFIKNFINYAFFSDPILILILIPLALWRLYNILIKKQESQPFFDSMTMAALMYVTAFLILNIYGPYYLLPAYIFAIPPLIYFLYKEKQKIILGKPILIFASALFILNTLPAGLHYLTYNKYLPVNFNKTLGFLIKDIQEREPNKKVDIFLDGVDLANGRGTFFIFGEFLLYKGLAANRFDLKANTPTTNPAPVLSKISLPFTVFTSDSLSEIKSGDYLVITPQITRKNITKEYLASLERNYSLIFRTESKFFVPNINLKTGLKYLIYRFLGSSGGEFIKNENIITQPNYYILIKK